MSENGSDKVLTPWQIKNRKKTSGASSVQSLSKSIKNNDKQDTMSVYTDGDDDNEGIDDIKQLCERYDSSNLKAFVQQTTAITTGIKLSTDPVSFDSKPTADVREEETGRRLCDELKKLLRTVSPVFLKAVIKAVDLEQLKETSSKRVELKNIKDALEDQKILCECFESPPQAFYDLQREVEIEKTLEKEDDEMKQLNSSDTSSPTKTGLSSHNMDSRWSYLTQEDVEEIKNQVTYSLKVMQQQ